MYEYEKTYDIRCHRKIITMSYTPVSYTHLDVYKRQDNYYASVYSVDQGVKRILEQLKKNGQYDLSLIHI